MGRKNAIDEVPEEYREECEHLDLSKLPVDFSTYKPEVKFVYNIATGEAREAGSGSNRDYSRGPFDIAGTADVFGFIGDDAVYVGDYKTGHSDVTSAGSNPQLLLLALSLIHISEPTRRILSRMPSSA